MIGITVKSILSTSHIQSAAYFARRAAQLEATYAGTTWGQQFAEGPYAEHRAYVVGSVFSSVAFLEAAINELISDASNLRQNVEPALGTENTDWLAALWDTGYAERARLLDKYQLVLRGSGRAMFDKGSNPFQDAADVVKLRNELIHYKPEFLSADDEKHWSQRLGRKLTPNPLFPAGPGNPEFPDKLLGHGCAQWAVSSCLAFADQFYTRIGLAPHYRGVRGMLATK